MEVLLRHHPLSQKYRKSKEYRNQNMREKRTAAELTILFLLVFFTCSFERTFLITATMALSTSCWLLSKSVRNGRCSVIPSEM